MIRSAKVLRVGLIGLGAIGSVVARELEADQEKRYQLVGCLTRTADQSKALSYLRICRNISELLNQRPDVVIEAAGPSAVVKYGSVCLQAGCNFMVVSIGALADPECLARLELCAAMSDRQILLPSGALGGLDYLGAAQLAGLTSVTYRGRKPPLAWLATPAQTMTNLNTLQVATLIFDGTARQACQAYPKNANVAAALALCTLGFDRVRVQLFADPAVDQNVHEIEASGLGGSFFARIANAPSVDNPKTSLITPYSVMRTLKSLQSRLSI